MVESNKKWLGDDRFFIDHTDNVQHHSRHAIKEYKYLVIHTMAEYLYDNGKVTHAEQFLSEMGLYPHFLVLPDGVVIQMLDTNLVGSHAKGFNSVSIGIEALIPGALTYEEFVTATQEEFINTVQWYALRELVTNIKKQYPQLEIVGHHDLSPKRKVDPGVYVNLDRLRDETL